jgi:hypothetical protein
LLTWGGALTNMKTITPEICSICLTDDEIAYTNYRNQKFCKDCLQFVEVPITQQYQDLSRRLANMEENLQRVLNLLEEWAPHIHRAAALMQDSKAVRLREALSRSRNGK